MNAQVTEKVLLLKTRSAFTNSPRYNELCCAEQLRPTRLSRGLHVFTQASSGAPFLQQGAHRSTSLFTARQPSATLSHVSEESSVLWEMSGEHLPPHGWTRHGGRGQGRGHGERRHRSTHSENPDVRLSKTLSYALRHGAHRLGLHMGSDGFVDVQELLAQRSLAGYEEADLRRVVESNDKQRFALRAHPTTGSLQIRANQGHSLQVEDLDLQPIALHGSDLPECVVHGTFARHLPSILRDGLSRRGRAHIHMAPGEPGAEGIISGMRGNCEIAIYIDIEKALQDGIPFYRSANGVILSSGNAQGVLPRQYFQRVMQLQPERKQLPLEGDTPC